MLLTRVGLEATKILVLDRDVCVDIVSLKVKEEVVKLFVAVVSSSLPRELVRSIVELEANDMFDELYVRVELNETFAAPTTVENVVGT